MTAFSNRFRNFIDQIQTGGSFTAADPAVYQYINLGRVKIHGVEAKGDYKWANGLGVRAAASWAKGSVRQTGVTGSRPLDSIEPFKLVLGTFYQAEASPFRAELSATRSAGKKLSRTNNSCNTATTACLTPPGFWLVDATASYRLLDHATVRVGVFNLFDKKYSGGATCGAWRAFDDPRRLQPAGPQCRRFDQLHLLRSDDHDR